MFATVAMLATACGSGGGAVEAEPAQEETRSITHEMGVTEVPVDPQRVVVLDTNKILATALLLDVPIVGYSDRPFDEAVLPFFDDESLTDAAQVGFNPANIEQVAAAEPDLIIGGTDEEDSYDQLSTIAPTVMFQYPGSAPWKDNLREVAAVFGDTEQTDQGIAEYEARAADIRARLGDRVGTEATLANLRALDDIRTMSSDWCSAAAMEEIGLVRPPAQQAEDLELSIERLGELDADLLIYFVGSLGTNPQEAAQAEEQIMTNPLWDTLEVVQAGETYSVDQNHWFTCGTLQAQNLVLDDLERILLG